MLWWGEARDLEFNNLYCLYVFISINKHTNKKTRGRERKDQERVRREGGGGEDPLSTKH